MESYRAKIENDIVVSVEVVTDSFFNSNSTRYAGQWVKIGNGTARPFCAIGYIYLSVNDKIIPAQPFASWSLDANDIWQPPTVKPAGNYYWDESTLSWLTIAT